jgi:hypothetical protein
VALRFCTISRQQHEYLARSNTGTDVAYIQCCRSRSCLCRYTCTCTFTCSCTCVLAVPASGPASLSVCHLIAVLFGSVRGPSQQRSGRTRGCRDRDRFRSGDCRKDATEGEGAQRFFCYTLSLSFFFFFCIFTFFCVAVPIFHRQKKEAWRSTRYTSLFLSSHPASCCPLSPTADPVQVQCCLVRSLLFCVLHVLSPSFSLSELLILAHSSDEASGVLTICGRIRAFAYAHPRSTRKEAFNVCCPVIACDDLCDEVAERARGCDQFAPVAF